MCRVTVVGWGEAAFQGVTEPFKGQISFYRVLRSVKSVSIAVLKPRRRPYEKLDIAQLQLRKSLD